MVFDWKEYLNQAHFLAGSHDYLFSEKAALRSAVSRAYYAAFCYSRNYARDSLSFLLTRSQRDHGLLRDYLRREGLANIASNLDDLRKWRNMCDYDDEVYNLSETVIDALQNAQEVIDSLP